MDKVIIVLDVGSTNFKAAAVSDDYNILWSYRQRQTPITGNRPYLYLDTHSVFGWIIDALSQAAGRFEVAAIIPCTHGSSAALVGAGADGQAGPDLVSPDLVSSGLVLPVMGYEAEIPADIADAYAREAPPFDEVYAPTNPAGLTLARQLFWQETAFPQAFSRIHSIMPYPQYWTWRLTGVAASDISSLAAQTHLWDPVRSACSSIAIRHGWDRLFAPIRPAWDLVGPISAAISDATGLAPSVPVLCGIHDSSANYLRYLSLATRDWTLLSTGTWLITFNPGQPLDRLDPVRDTVSNTDVDRNPVACSRFMIGREFEIIAGPEGLGAEQPAGVQGAAFWTGRISSLIKRGVMALPSFTDTGGPVPGTGARGRIRADTPEDLSAVDRRALASLYCALMTVESLDAVGAGRLLIIDGPFATDPLYPRLIAALRPDARVVVSAERDGTIIGSTLLWDRHLGRQSPLPDLGDVTRLEIPGIAGYADEWRGRAHAIADEGAFGR